MLPIALHKKHIVNFLNKFNTTYGENVEYIYGGVTKDPLNIRRNGHIDARPPSPLLCTRDWKISEKPITTITIRDMSKLDEYYNLIAQVEQYLIDCLGQCYPDARFVNDIREDGRIAQMGGAGVDIKKMKLGDEFKMYIFYKLDT
jgi:hypothetical protein